jgi:hypothetical protein
VNPLTPPRESVSHYRLIEPLGHGAMGDVWLAEDTELPRKVAVKLLARHLAGDPDAVERLLREARAAASVDHPAVVTVYAVGVVDGQPFLVMPRSLHWVQRSSGVPLRSFAGVVRPTKAGDGKRNHHHRMARKSKLCETPRRLSNHRLTGTVQATGRYDSIPLVAEFS